MISYLKGDLTHVSPDRMIVEVGGVGYQVYIPLSTYENLPSPGAEVTILTYLHVREDELSLYGFMTSEERALFKLLIGVSRIGPKAALGILGGLPVDSFKAAVSSGDIDLLSSLHGVGKKTAERLVLELKDKISMIPRLREEAGGEKMEGEEEKASDVMRALLSLGYRQNQANKALVKALKNAEPDWPVEKLLKEALKHI